jgi:hypothetical protein
MELYLKERMGALAAKDTKTRASSITPALPAAWG